MMYKNIGERVGIGTSTSDVVNESVGFQTGECVMGWHYDENDLDENDGDKIRELLVGHKVTKVADDKLTLDDGTVLTIYPNEGGCSCGAGDYELTELNGCDNIITNVSLQDESKKDEYGYESDTVYSIFVYAENQALKLVEITGSDGSGYYGTGYAIHVVKPKGDGDKNVA